MNPFFLIMGYFLLSFTSIGCAKELVSSERTAIFPATEAAKLIQTVCYHSPDATGYWTPKEMDLVGVEDTLDAFLKSHKVEEKKDWKNFRRQATGIKRGDELYIFIYYFHYERAGSDPESWKTVPYLVFDGGSWFFRVLYEVKKKKFVWYESNGEA
jgi:hypothetical protein